MEVEISETQKRLNFILNLIKEWDKAPFSREEIKHLATVKGFSIAPEEVDQALDCLVTEGAIISPDPLSDDWFRIPETPRDFVQVAQKLNQGDPLSSTMKSAIRSAVKTGEHGKKGKISSSLYQRSTLMALKRRGLAEYRRYDDPRGNGWFLTDPLYGQVLLNTLEEADV